MCLGLMTWKLEVTGVVLVTLPLVIGAGVVATTGTKVGAVTFTFTADNGTEDTADDVTGESKPYTCLLYTS